MAWCPCEMRCISGSTKRLGELDERCGPKPRWSALLLCEKPLTGRRGVLAGERHECHGEYLASFNPSLRGPGECGQHLIGVRRSEGNHQPAAGTQLVEQGLRNTGRSGGNDDGIEWSAVTPTLVAVSRPYRNIAVTQSREPRCRFGRQSGNDLDAVHLSNQPRQHRSLIAATGADLQYDIARLGLQQIGHEGDDEGLRNRLAVADRLRRVVISNIALIGGEKFVTWHLGQRCHHSGNELILAETGAGEHGCLSNIAEHAGHVVHIASSRAVLSE